MPAPKTPERWRPPDWLPDDARAWHQAIIDQLREAGRLAQPIHALLLAQALAQYERCTRALNDEGQVLTIRNDKGEVKRLEIAPEAQLQIRLIDKARALIKDLRLDTPAEDEGPGQPVDPFAALRQRMDRITSGSNPGRN